MVIVLRTISQLLVQFSYEYIAQLKVLIIQLENRGLGCESISGWVGLSIQPTWTFELVQKIPSIQSNPTHVHP